jgi:Golgi nucleoside diphosphatase
MQNKGLIKFFRNSICIGEYLPTFFSLANKVKAMQKHLLQVIQKKQDIWILSIGKEKYLILDLQILI